MLKRLLSTDLSVGCEHAHNTAAFGVATSKRTSIPKADFIFSSLSPGPPAPLQSLNVLNYQTMRHLFSIYLGGGAAKADGERPGSERARHRLHLELPRA